MGNLIVISTIFTAGLLLVVIKPLGANFSLIPGDLGDSRLNNFLLEHFYRWLRGFDHSFWTVPFFYPYPKTLAFGDNFLGSGPFYALFRFTGLDRESAFQAWWVMGYCLNFLAATYALFRLEFKSLAVGAGAFFFTFGLLITAQDGHAQLLYRFGVPLACLSLWNMLESPTLWMFASIIFWLVWQFFLSIYTGVFLFLLLVTLAIIAPLFIPFHSQLKILRFWPHQIALALRCARPIERILALLVILALLASLCIYFWPYYQVTKLYGFSRTWDEVSSMTPGWRSYLLADQSWLWHPISNLITGVPVRWEHQLFPGIAAIILAFIGLAWRKDLKKRKAILLYAGAGLVLIAITFSIHGFSLYRILWNLPGLGSIRVVTRIVLILMWPLALLISYGIETLMEQKSRQPFFSVVTYVLIGLLLAEAVIIDHTTYNKTAAQARLDRLRNQIPSVIPVQPVLLVANKQGDPWFISELDGMLLSQQLGWPTLNGYAGNLPPGYGYSPAINCINLPKRIIAYRDFTHITSESYYLIVSPLRVGGWYH